MFASAGSYNWHRDRSAAMRPRRESQMAPREGSAERPGARFSLARVCPASRPARTMSTVKQRKQRDKQQRRSSASHVLYETKSQPIPRQMIDGLGWLVLRQAVRRTAGHPTALRGEVRRPVRRRLSTTRKHGDIASPIYLPARWIICCRDIDVNDSASALHVHPVAARMPERPRATEPMMDKRLTLLVRGRSS